MSTDMAMRSDWNELIDLDDDGDVIMVPKERVERVETARATSPRARQRNYVIRCVDCGKNVPPNEMSTHRRHGCVAATTTATVNNDVGLFPPKATTNPRFPPFQRAAALKSPVVDMNVDTDDEDTDEDVLSTAAVAPCPEQIFPKSRHPRVNRNITNHLYAKSPSKDNFQDCKMPARPAMAPPAMAPSRPSAAPAVGPLPDNNRAQYRSRQSQLHRRRRRQYRQSTDAPGHLYQPPSIPPAAAAAKMPSSNKNSNQIQNGTRQNVASASSYPQTVSATGLVLQEAGSFKLIDLCSDTDDSRDAVVIDDDDDDDEEDEKNVKNKEDFTLVPAEAIPIRESAPALAVVAPTRGVAALPKNDEDENVNNSNNTSATNINHNNVVVIEDSTETTDQNEWTCVYCTLRNPQQLQWCEACGNAPPNHFVQDDSDRSENREGTPNRNRTARAAARSAMLGTLLGGANAYLRGQSMSSAFRGAVGGAMGGLVLDQVRASQMPSANTQSAASRQRINNNGNHTGNHLRRLQSQSNRPRADRTTHAHLHNSSTSASRQRRLQQQNLQQFQSDATTHRRRRRRQALDEEDAIMRMLETEALMAAVLMNDDYHHQAHLPHQAQIDNMSYDELLHTFGDGTEHLGASQRDINALPVATIQDPKQELPDDDQDCCICLQSFEKGDVRKTMPCLHGFHKKCLDQWLKTNGCCPICKFKLKGD